MDPVALPELAADPEPRYIEIARDQPQYQTLPALAYADGKILTEWRLTEGEREAILRGENIRLWIWIYPPVCGACGCVGPRTLQPVQLEVTSEDRS